MEQFEKTAAIASELASRTKLLSKNNENKSVLIQFRSFISAGSVECQCPQVFLTPESLFNTFFIPFVYAISIHARGVLFDCAFALRVRNET